MVAMGGGWFEVLSGLGLSWVHCLCFVVWVLVWCGVVVVKLKCCGGFAEMLIWEEEIWWLLPVKNTLRNNMQNFVDSQNTLLSYHLGISTKKIYTKKHTHILRTSYH